MAKPVKSARKALLSRLLSKELAAQPNYTPTNRTPSKGFRPGDPQTSLPPAKTEARV